MAVPQITAQTFSLNISMALELCKQADLLATHYAGEVSDFEGQCPDQDYLVYAIEIWLGQKVEEMIQDLSHSLAFGDDRRRVLDIYHRAINEDSEQAREPMAA